MYEFMPFEKTAWAIQGGFAIANVLSLILNLLTCSRRKFINLVRVVLGDQIGLLFVLALLLEILPVLMVYDTAIYGGSKSLLFFRVYRAIFIGTVANLVLLIVNRSIISARNSANAA